MGGGRVLKRLGQNDAAEFGQAGIGWMGPSLWGGSFGGTVSTAIADSLSVGCWGAKSCDLILGMAYGEWRFGVLGLLQFIYGINNFIKGFMGRWLASARVVCSCRHGVCFSVAVFAEMVAYSVSVPIKTVSGLRWFRAVMVPLRSSSWGGGGSPASPIKTVTGLR